jgi:hypothetical protein
MLVELSPLDRLMIGLDPSLLLESVGLSPDPWQRDFLRSRSDRTLLLCARQLGKSTATAALALHTALFQPESLVLLLSPSLRQSTELYRKVSAFYGDLGKPVAAVEENASSLTLVNGSRIVSLPASPATIRGYSGVRLLVIDEGAMTSDELLVAVTPMLGVSQGRLVALSTPMGKRGWFFAAWEDEAQQWTRVKVTATECKRIDPAFLEEQRRLLGPRWFRQEFLCSFEESIDQVFSTESIEAAFISDESPLFGD